jgi:predicted SprT family Zn-dependent metalloprotease
MAIPAVIDPKSYGDISTDKQVQIVFEHAFTVFDITGTWGWNQRFLRLFGRAHISAAHVELSNKIWPLASVEERKETIYHEVAHIAAWQIFQERGHGAKWKQCMSAVGYKDAERCHNVDVSKLLMHRRHPVFCDCRVHLVTKNALNQMRAGRSKFRCIKCQTYIKEDMK